MSIRRQRTANRGRRTAVSGHHSPCATSRRNSEPSERYSRGFTLVEMLLAVSVSVMVFMAMGMLLSKCFSLWMDASANWRLAQVARISRERILTGAFPASSGQPISGLLGATNTLTFSSGDWACLRYRTMDSAGTAYQLYGWSDSAERDILINRSVGSPSFAYGQGVATYPSGTAPAIKADLFEIGGSNKIVTITYRVRMSAAGKTFTQPHSISAWLINKEN